MELGSLGWAVNYDATTMEPSLDYDFDPDSPRPYPLGNLVKLFYTEPTRELRPVAEATSWFQTNRRLNGLGDEELASAYEELMPAHGYENEYSLGDWQRCVHSPWEALSHRELDPKTEAFATAISAPGCLSFNSTSLNLHLVESGPEDYEFLGKRGDVDGQEHDITFDLVTDDGDIVGRTVPMDERWAGVAIRNDIKYEVAVIAGAWLIKSILCTRKAFYQHHLLMKYLMSRRPKTQFKHLRSIPFCLVVMVMEQKGLVNDRVTIGIVDLISWTEASPQWKPIVLI